MKIYKGSTRWVVVTKKYAFKFPRLLAWRNFLQGLLANMQEVEFSGFDPLLCPVIFNLPLGFMNVMPSTEPVSVDQDLTHVFDSLENEERVLPVERKHDSFGILNGNIVAVDYGN